MSQDEDKTENTGLGVVNSGAAFASKDRAASLRSKLTPRTEPSQSTEERRPPAQEPAATKTTTTPAPPDSQQPDVGSAPRAAGPVGAQNRAAHLAIELIEKLRTYATKHRITQTEVIFTAIEQAHSAGELATSFSRPPADGLFARPAQRRRRDGRARPQLTLRLTPHNEQILNQLVEELGAGSRSELIEAALEHFFGDTYSNHVDT